MGDEERGAARGSGTGVPARGPSSSRNPTPGCPKPGRKLLLRRDGGRGLPWTRGRLGDGTGHRAPQPWRRPPPGGESYATRRPGGSPGGRLGGGRETRHTRATADGPRDGAVTRGGPGHGRAGAAAPTTCAGRTRWSGSRTGGAAALPATPGSGSRLRSAPSHPTRPVGLDGPARRSGWSGNRAPRVLLDPGPPPLGPVRVRKWRSGRIVPPRTRSLRRRNRGITRKLPSASEALI